MVSPIKTSVTPYEACFVPGKVIKVDFAVSEPTPGYDIVIGHSIVSEAGTLIRLRLGTRRCVIITDTHVEPLYAARAEAVLAAGGLDVLSILCVPAGETSKTFSTLQSLLDKILALDIDRKTLIIALGGGVVGDLAGLAASVIMRGLDLVQIPTTLLAQVDSAVGGKTGIDTVYGKNIIGTFYQPRLVISDVTLLDSLPAREMRAGYAEIIKYGVIQDAAFFRWCVAHGSKLLTGDHEGQIHAISYSCAAKARIVGDDERETGDRAVLNFGHTFGHALESAHGYSSALVHGEAVAIGMLMALRLSVRLNLCPQQDYEDVRAHLAAIGLPVMPPSIAYNIDSLINFMRRDKKAEGRNITLVLSRGIGQVFVCNDVDVHEIRAVWEEFICP